MKKIVFSLLLGFSFAFINPAISYNQENYSAQAVAGQVDFNTHVAQNTSNKNDQYFTIGSTQNEVLSIQGQPNRIMGTTWWYGFSYVSFRDGKVDGYSNEGNLKIRITNIN